MLKNLLTAVEKPLCTYGLIGTYWITVYRIEF